MSKHQIIIKESRQVGTTSQKCGVKITKKECKKNPQKPINPYLFKTSCGKLFAKKRGKNKK